MPRDEPRTRFVFAELGVSPASAPVRTPGRRPGAEGGPRSARSTPPARGGYARHRDLATARTPCAVAVCTAPGEGAHDARVIGPDDITPATRGTGANTRHIHSIAMEPADVADRLLVTEVCTPSGNWSSCPPPRHEEDAFPNITFLEEP